MSAIRPVTREHHGSKYWQRSRGYQFAATRTIAPVAAAEISKAAVALPLAFIQVADIWSMVAVLGITPGQNLFVVPNGKWAGNYIPAVFRGHPFQVAQTQRGQYTLCVDEASGLVGDHPEGTPFFDEDGNPSGPVRKVLDFLLKTAQSSEVLSRACTVLAQQGVMEAWSLTVEAGDQQRQLAGLHRINEAALNSLPDEALLTLRRAGALPVAYAQLLSMGNLAMLRRLANIHHEAKQAQAQARTASSKNIDLDRVFSLSDSETVNWDSLTKPE